MSRCTWCTHAMRGPRAHSGVRKGTPFQISTMPSRGPWPPEDLADHRGGEHHEPTVLAHDVVAVAVTLVGVALGVGGAHHDLDARLGPQGEDLGGVDLGAARLDVDQVAPGEDVDAAETGLGRHRGDVGDARRGPPVHEADLSRPAGSRDGRDRRPRGDDRRGPPGALVVDALVIGGADGRSLLLVVLLLDVHRPDVVVGAVGCSRR